MSPAWRDATAAVRSPRLILGLLAALTLAALALRLPGMGQDLFADELYTFDDVHGRGPRGVVEHLRSGGTEDNPPLFFLLAWASAKLGDDTVWIRLPSLVLGTATVPVVYALGRRALSPGAGLVAAALVAVSPFAIYYSAEARAYATLAFLVALSTLLLLKALEGRRPGWWAAYAATACAVLYTHYTGAIPVAAQAAWTLWAQPAHRRPIAVATGAAVIAYLPWVPTEFGKAPLITLAPVGQFTADHVGVNLLRFLPGHPLRPAAVVPGTAILVGLGLALLALVILAWTRSPGSPDGGRRRAPDRNGLPVLLTALAVGLPAALALYSALRTNVFLARNLSAALPALAVLLGGLVVARRGVLAGAAAALVLGLVGVGTVRALGEDVRGTRAPEVVRFIEDRLKARDSIVQLSFFGTGAVSERALVPYFRRPHSYYVAGGGKEAEAWREAIRGGRVFLVYDAATFGDLPRAGPGRCFERRSARRFSATIVGIYGLAPRDRACAEKLLGPG